MNTDDFKWLKDISHHAVNSSDTTEKPLQVNMRNQMFNGCL